MIGGTKTQLTDIWIDETSGNKCFLHVMIGMHSYSKCITSVYSTEEKIYEDIYLNFNAVIMILTNEKYKILNGEIVIND